LWLPAADMAQLSITLTLILTLTLTLNFEWRLKLWSCVSGKLKYMGKEILITCESALGTFILSI
jgi:hypothetical protein